MYELFFGLGRRPFAAMPDAACFIPIHGTSQALSNLVQCASSGRGIGVLTAPAGLGKTLVCQRLARELGAQFHIVLLPSGNFLTRRSLLQAVLFELGHSYVRMGDQELRLELTAVLRRLSPERRGVVLIVDEAHLLAPRMVEELRALTNVAEAGEPLVRLIVSGQLSLEENLSRPELDAFNQRVGAQVMLQSFTRDESIEYMGRRLAWAGANVSDVFTHEAVQVISEASDGSPRCIHQLCDHSLLLGYLSEEKPVSIRTVREALDDVKHLPLTWNEPISRQSPRADFPRTPTGKLERIVEQEVHVDQQRSVDLQRTTTKTDRWFDADDAITTPDPSESQDANDSRIEAESAEFGSVVEFDSVVEFGDEVATTCIPQNPLLSQRDVVRPAQPALVQPSLPASEYKPASAVIDEEVVIDRYAALDAAIGRLARTVMIARAAVRRREPSPIVSPKQAPLPAKELLPVKEKEDVKLSARFDVVLPDDVPAAITSRDSSQISLAEENAQKSVQVDRRSYEHLFSELRRRRKGA